MFLQTKSQYRLWLFGLNQYSYKHITDRIHLTFHAFPTNTRKHQLLAFLWWQLPFGLITDTFCFPPNIFTARQSNTIRRKQRNISDRSYELVCDFMCFLKLFPSSGKQAELPRHRWHFVRSQVSLQMAPGLCLFAGYWAMWVMTYAPFWNALK